MQPSQHRLTLKFEDPDLERQFLSTVVREAPARARIGIVFGTVLFLLFAGVWAAITAPDQLRYALWLTYGVCIPASILGFGLTWLPGYGRWEWPRPLLLAAMEGSFIALQALQPGVPHAYTSAGVITVILYIYLVVRIRLLATVSATLIPSLVYLIVLAQQLEARWVLHYSFLLFIVNAFGLLAAYSGERLRRRDWFQSREIQRLLLNVLPEAIAIRLQREGGLIADGVDSVTVLFADIVGFTPLSERMTPAELVTLLDRVFSAFDELAERAGVEKIKTIGDSYMAVGGAPSPRADHAAAVVALGQQMLAALAGLAPGLELRIGVHSGPVVAGVIGKRRYSYDLWGDTVNTASRMESHGVAGAIQLTDATRARLGDSFPVEDRGTIHIKGKGPMRTWLVR